MRPTGTPFPFSRPRTSATAVYALPRPPNPRTVTRPKRVGRAARASIFTAAASFLRVFFFFLMRSVTGRPPQYSSSDSRTPLYIRGAFGYRKGVAADGHPFFRKRPPVHLAFEGGRCGFLCRHAGALDRLPQGPLHRNP